MCVYYIGFNKVCPNDLYPLPWIDQLVNTTSGHEGLNFLDALSSITKFLWSSQIMRICLLLLNLGHIATQPCRSVKKVGVTY